MRKLIPGLAALGAAVLFSLWAWPHLPAEVPTHFDLHGQADGWSPRLLGAALLPAIGVLLAALFSAVPSIDPKRANYASFSGAYWTLVNAVLVFLAGLHIVVLGKALGWNVSINRVTPLAIGGLFVLLGALMPRFQPNWFVGIRTPWTLSNDAVWRKTHVFGGVVFVISGFVLAASAVAPMPWALVTALCVTVAGALVTVAYSYIVWRRERGSPS